MGRKRDPRGINQLAYEIVSDLTNEQGPWPEAAPLRVAAGRKGGKKGGLVRAKNLTSAQRSAIAKKAALTRWKRD